MNEVTQFFYGKELTTIEDYSEAFSVLNNQYMELENKNKRLQCELLDLHVQYTKDTMFQSSVKSTGESIKLQTWLLLSSSITAASMMIAWFFR